MTRLMPIVSFVGLALVLFPALAYLAGSLEKNTMTTIMLVGTLIWFASAPAWMGKETGRRNGDRDGRGTPE